MDESKIEEKQVKENDIDHTPEKKKDKPMDKSPIATTSKVVSEDTSAKKIEPKTTEGDVSMETVPIKTSPIKPTIDVAVVKQQNKIASSVPHVTADDLSPIEPMEVDGCKTLTVVEETKKEEKAEKIKQHNILPAESIKKNIDITPAVNAEMPKTNSIPENEKNAVTNVSAILKSVPEEKSIDRAPRDQVAIKNSEENNSLAKPDIPVKESTIEGTVTPVGKPTILPTLSPTPQPTGAVVGNKNENSNLCK